MIRVGRRARNRAEQRRRSDRQHLTAASEADRRRARQRLRRTAGERVKRIEHGVDARLDVTLAAAQRGQPERDQRVLKLTQVVAAQRQVLQQVARARVAIRVAPLDPRAPALRRLAAAARGSPTAARSTPPAHDPAPRAPATSDPRWQAAECAATCRQPPCRSAPAPVMQSGFIVLLERLGERPHAPARQVIDSAS